MVLRDSWNGMSDFWEIVKTTPKTITVRKLEWEICSPDNPDDVDPVHKAVKLTLDHGHPVPELDPQGKEIIRRKFIKFGNVVSCLGYSGGRISLVEDLNKKYIFYWG